MGKSTFICRVDNAEQFTKAVRSIVAHNISPMENTGSVYTDEEFKRIDPMRFAFAKRMKEHLGPDVVTGCQQRWTRGEDIRVHDGFTLVSFEGHLWLEVSNGGGGACSTLFLQNAFAEVGWIGTEGKPDGFYEAPVAVRGQFDTLRTEINKRAQRWKT